MTTTKLTYGEFKTRRNNFKSTQPLHFQVEENLEEVTKLAYSFYLKGRIPQYAK